MEDQAIAIEDELSWMPASDPTATLTRIRQELKAVTGHLLSPTAYGINASLPHLEAAVNGFSGFLKLNARPQAETSLASLRAEIAVATQLFENAYSLQAGWAAQLGLDLDGSAKQLLYSRPGRPATAPVHDGLAHGHTAWEG